MTDGAEIVVEVQQTQRGLQAVAVIAIAAARGTAEPAMEELDDVSAEEIAALPLEPARVKWFDRAKGFGFANIFGQEADIFIHVEVLRRSGFAEVAPGEALALRVIEGRRGRMAVQVAPWEVGLSAGK